MHSSIQCPSKNNIILGARVASNLFLAETAVKAQQNKFVVCYGFYFKQSKV